MNATALFQRSKRVVSDGLRSRWPRLFAALKHSAHLATGRIFQEDILDLWTGRRDPLTPPARLLFDGSKSYAEFVRWGDEFVRHLIDRGLQPDHRVLEIGSGNGKNARALTRWLEPPGSYDGIEIVPAGVAWCRDHITPRFPHFCFHHADVCNRTYHPAGRTRASCYWFPFPDRSFDLVFLTSVFTHMLSEDMANYVAEIARVLKPTGRCFASFYLITAESTPAIDSSRSVPNFRHPLGPACRVADRDWPEDAVAHDEKAIRALFALHGLKINDPIEYGGWRNGLSHSQDMVWSTKVCPPSPESC
jgi:SAM-dependent methyltransferase